jgi:hypothetical protein
MITKEHPHMTEGTRRKALGWSLRIWGYSGIVIFGLLFIGFLAQSPILAEQGGIFNWTIWNNVTCHNTLGHSHLCHVPAMLLIIYVVWSIFAIIAANKPERYSSFLEFTTWANAAHALLMAGQALTEIDRYWLKFLTDIPYIAFIALAILFLRPPGKEKGIATESK